MRSSALILAAWLLLGLPQPGTAQGPSGTNHWAFTPPSRPTPPAPRQTNSVQSPIDAFVRARLEVENLQPAPPAAPETLHRRLCLDLTGLPPSPEETSNFVRAFRQDPRQAVSDRVDQLLASPRYGEHMASRWLDLARYADTSGFQGDPFRSMWRWRDYVIESFNRNLPFDQFTIEQLAGDLLPNPTLNQRLATGFNRNHRFNTEFGSINEEWLVENVIDRVETTSAVWLGLTMGCGRCHDHKYDPISQTEFYQFFAFFNNLPERGVFWDGNDPAFAPSLRAPTPADQEKLAALEATVQEREAEVRRMETSLMLSHEQQAWERRRSRQFRRELQPHLEVDMAVGPNRVQSFLFPTSQVLHLPLDGSLAGRFGTRTTLTNRTQITTNQVTDVIQSIISNSQEITQRVAFAKTVAVRSPVQPEFGDGAVGQSLRLSGLEPALALSGVLDQDRATLAFWLRPEVPSGVILHKLGRQELFPIGILLTLTNGHLHFEAHHKIFEFDATMVPLEMTSNLQLPLHEWTHIALVLDGKRRRRGPTLFVNGQAQQLEPIKASARGLSTLVNAEPLTIGGGGGQAGLRGWVDDLRWFDRALTDREVRLLAAIPQAMALSSSPLQRSPQEQIQAGSFYRTFLSSSLATQHVALAEAVAKLEEFQKDLPEVMVMAERPEPATARVLFRGQYDAPREQVSANIPASLGTLGPSASPNRLHLARWLVSTNNPLTARVFVNRVWEQLFGIGLVRTSEDFGTQAEVPSHPELLDWLAVDWMQGGWDIKSLLKKIVTSATYQQSSSCSPALRERDPENRLLARGPRFRLPAEAIRDLALAVSGSLVEQVGGPSVTPYLPGDKPKESPQLYRRSLYSLWQRTRFNPSLATFDAPSREACTVKRPRTNTPLQALALMNEVTFVEASRRLAERTMRANATLDGRIAFMVQTALGRPPETQELAALRRITESQLERYRSNRIAAEDLVAVGASKADPSLNVQELAAYTLVASTLMNLDEFITKE
ncbi:MAG: DUF1553 domain-containing protein [Verrucomicrobiales bacterium]|nr:DUF1553 domain-containing protein [Verrucomicrobiales bacterium]